MLYGYIVSVGYLAVIILFFSFLNKKFKVDVEITRKILHILIGFTWVLMDIFWEVSYHQIIMCGIFVVVNSISRKFEIFPGIERKGSSDHPGTVYYALAMLILAIVSYLYPPMYYPFGMAVMCLSFGDGIAPLFALIFKKHNIKLVANKTLAGSLACFVFSFVALIVFNVCYKLNFHIESLLAIASVATIMELFVQNGLDNFGITFSVALFALGVTLNLFNTAFYICVALAFVVVLAILITRSLTVSAAFLAYIMLLVSAYCTGYFGFLLYVLPFAIIAVAGKIRSVVLKKRGFEKEKKGRNFVQVAINGLLTMICLIVFKLTDMIGFFILAAVAIAEAFADSMASDIGSLSKKEPFDLFRFKRVQSGISGGMSLLGSTSAIISSLVVALICFGFTKNPIDIAFVLGFGFFGTLIDSLLGSYFQALYLCPVCGEQTEKRIHHTHITTLIKGNKRITNNTVNLLANIITTAIAAVYFII